MQINAWSVVVATIAMFVIGAVWYMVFFAKKWGEMHGFNELSKEKQKEMSSQMTPFYVLQLIMTVMSSIVLAYMLSALPTISPILVGCLVWAGFALPAIVSGVIFGGTPGKYIAPKIYIEAGEALVRLVVAALIISLF